MKKVFLPPVCAVFLLVSAGCASWWEKTEDDGMIRIVHNLPAGGGKAGAVCLREACPADVVLGQPFEYTLEVTNRTGAEIVGVTVTDRLARGLELVASNPVAAPAAGNTVRYDLGSLAPGQVKTVRVRVVARNPGALGHSAFVDYRECIGATIRVSIPGPAAKNGGP